ncbi:MAG: cysteine desulfurase-like protein [Calditrichia bacterium]
MPLDISRIREQFPALSLTDNGQRRIYLDNPAGTQVPQRVVDRVSDYFIRCNANRSGQFTTARESDKIVFDAHAAVADLLNAYSPDEIVFGQNMTSVTYHIARSLAKLFKAGDKLIVTRMDHDANISPWLQMAEDVGMDVLWWEFNTETYQFELDDLQKLLDRGGVKFAAVNYASNALGTINDIKTICSMIGEAGALSFIDAVQFVPHAPTDVQKIGCDLLACSIYKIYGGHQGAVWAKKDFLESLFAYKVRPANDGSPWRFETGTQSHEGQAGTLGAMEYLEDIGKTMAQEYESYFPQFSGRRLHLHTAMSAIKDYEEDLSAHLISGLLAIPGVTVHGISDPEKMHLRVPTVAFTHRAHSPAAIAKALGEANIFVWNGHYYAIEVIASLGLTDSGGMVRVGAGHYNTTAEIDELLQVVADL